MTHPDSTPPREVWSRAFDRRTKFKETTSFDNHPGPWLLERLHGDDRVPAGTYDTSDQAARALDEWTAEGIHANQLRLTPLEVPKHHHHHKG